LKTFLDKIKGPGGFDGRKKPEVENLVLLFLPARRRKCSNMDDMGLG
jgi:hypothetical protein